ncbi:MAG: MFS transporter [Proteobacteria bacterium]|nr:MFS transporter [Pseudomonadota bacterium]
MSSRLPRRVLLVGLCSLAVFIAYTDRVNIAVAAVDMRLHFGWSLGDQGVVLASFYLGYLCCMLASGWCATRYGGRRVLGLAVIVWSLCTLLTPLAASLSLATLIGTRVAMGIGEAAVFPAAIALYGQWIPPAERTRAVGWLMNGIPAGTVVGLAASGWLVGRFGWPMAFYAFGSLGLLWAVAWFRIVRDRPAQDARLSAPERALLAGVTPESDTRAPIPWRGLMLRGRLWATVAAHFASVWTLYVLLSWLPSYFRDTLGLSIGGAGLYSALPWLAMFATTSVAAPLSDRLIARGVPVTRVRKLFQCAGLLGAALLLVLARDAHSLGGAVGCLCGATAMLGFTWLGYAPALIDLAPRHAPLLVGVSNSFATLPGIVGVGATGFLVEVTGSYAAPFLLTAAVGVAGAAIFAAGFRAEPLVE